MPFQVTFSEDYPQIEFVKKTIEQWNQGKRNFEIKTSGSTGEPKTIEWNKNLIEWQCENFKRFIKNDNNKPLFCPLPIEKTGGFMQLIRSLYLEIPIYFTTPKIEITIPPDIAFSSASFTPAQMEHLIDNSPRSLLQFETILIGGAPISEKLNQKISQIKKVEVYETYGMTETASNVALRCISRNKTDFKIHSGVQIKYESSGAIISIPEIKLEVKTNDYLIETKNGFVFKGRLDHYINSDGLKIDVLELENQIIPIFEKIFQSKNFYITGQEHPKFSQVPVIFTDIFEIENERVMAFFNELDQQIEGKLLPYFFYQIQQFHYTDTQKLKRFSLENYTQSKTLINGWKNPKK